MNRGRRADRLPLEAVATTTPAGLAGGTGIVLVHWTIHDPISNTEYSPGVLRGLSLQASVFPGAAIVGTIRWCVSLQPAGLDATVYDSAQDRKAAQRYIWAEGTLRAVSALSTGRWEADINVGTRRRFELGDRLAFQLFNEGSVNFGASGFATVVGHVFVASD